MIKIIKNINGFLDRFLVDKVAKYVVYVFAVISVLVPIIIIGFVVINGLSIFGELDIGEFLFGQEWRPHEDQYGAFRIILGSILVTLLSMAIAIVIAIGCAILLAEIAPTVMRSFMRPLVELLAGIPSVVYGLLGIILLVPLIGRLGDVSGFSILAAGLVLALMVLPTIISISEDAIRAVPSTYNQGALALGCSRWQSLWHVVIPAAKSGIIAAVTLGAGRAIGETMAVMMVIGNSIGAITSIFSPARTLPSSLALELQDATDLHRTALFGLAMVLMLLILIINSAGTVFFKRKARINHE